MFATLVNGNIVPNFIKIEPCLNFVIVTKEVSAFEASEPSNKQIKQWLLDARILSDDFWELLKNTLYYYVVYLRIEQNVCILECMYVEIWFFWFVSRCDKKKYQLLTRVYPNVITFLQIIKLSNDCQMLEYFRINNKKIH